MNRSDVWHFRVVPLKEKGMPRLFFRSCGKTGKVVSDLGPHRESNTLGWWGTQEEAGPGHLLRATAEPLWRACSLTKDRNKPLS